MREGKEERLWFQKETELSISVPTIEQNLSGKALREALAASVNFKDQLCSHTSVWKHGVNMSTLLCIEKEQHLFHQLHLIFFTLVPDTEKMCVFLCIQVLMLSCRLQCEGIHLQIWFAYHSVCVKTCRLSKSGSSDLGVTKMEGFVEEGVFYICQYCYFALLRLKWRRKTGGIWGCKYVIVYVNSGSWVFNKELSVTCKAP